MLHGFGYFDQCGGLLGPIQAAIKWVGAELWAWQGTGESATSLAKRIVHTVLGLSDIERIDGDGQGVLEKAADLER